MMDSGPVRNMYSTLSNKSEKYCISLPFIIRIYHDARSSECEVEVCYFKSYYVLRYHLCRQFNVKYEKTVKRSWWL